MADGEGVFALVPLDAEPLKVKRKRRAPGAFDLAKASTAEWRVEPHVCRLCFGRVVSLSLKPDGRLYRCTNCGAQGSGLAGSVCACGMKIGGRDAGIRCVVNVLPTPDNPSEIVAKEVK